MANEVTDKMAQRIEHDIRQLIGDQAVQIIVLRAALEAKQEAAAVESTPEKRNGKTSTLHG
jgi:hypothetical protein